MWRALGLKAALLTVLGCARPACVPTDTDVCLEGSGRIRLEPVPPLTEGLRLVPSGFLLPPGLALCVDALRTPDAGATRVSPLELTAEVDDASVARLAEPGDCPGLGVIGVAAGDATLTVSHGEDRAYASVLVRTVELTLEATPQRLRAGERQPWRCRDGACPDLHHPRAAVSDRARVLARGLQLTSDAPDVATVELGPSGYEVIARAVGEATLRGAYELFGGRYALEPSTIVVSP